MNTKNIKKVPVEDCIRFMESRGWKLINRQRSWYCFYNENGPKYMELLHFTLPELRDAYLNGL